MYYTSMMSKEQTNQQQCNVLNRKQLHFHNLSERIGYLNSRYCSTPILLQKWDT